jgi:hypothetical protein
VQKGPKCNRGVKQDGGRLNCENKEHRKFGGPLQGTSALEKKIGHKERKKKGSKAQKRRQRKMKVDTMTRKGTRNEKKEGRVRKVFL